LSCPGCLRFQLLVRNRGRAPAPLRPPGWRARLSKTSLRLPDRCSSLRWFSFGSVLSVGGAAKTLLFDDVMRATLAALLVGSPEDHGWARPTWTQELLARQVAHDTGVRVSDSTVGR